MFDNFIQGGQGHGPIANRLVQNNFDLGCLRPYVGDDGRHYMTVNREGQQQAVLLHNADATLKIREWILLDETVLRISKSALVGWSDLMSAGARYDLPNGMAHTVLQYQTMSDINKATMSMDGLRKGERDRPVYDIGNLPLPIIHKDFSFSARELMVSRNGGMPLDTTTAELAARRVAEMVEETLTGVSSAISYGGGSIYGYTNFPNRITATITAPTAGGWTPMTTYNEVLAMKQAAFNKQRYGPYMLYNSPNFEQYLDRRLVTTGETAQTLRGSLLQIGGISQVKTLFSLTGFSLVLVQMTSENVRGVNGLGITTIQWQEQGGMELLFKVICIMVPQLRADYLGNSGIVHGTTA